MNAPDDRQSDSPADDHSDLGSDFQRLYGRRIDVPEDLDNRMLATIADQWALPPETGESPRPWPNRWRRALAYSGVAAALLITAIWMNLPRQPLPPPQLAQAPRVDAADIDGDGHVNILDAYQLAKHLASRRIPVPGAPGWHDINGDGAMNRLDVDAVAYRAVQLEGRPG